MGKRGRPKGSKNKVAKNTGPVLYQIGSGTQYKFPIVRDGNERKRVAELIVGAETYADALQLAIDWAVAYSAKQNETRQDLVDILFWPLVKYRSIGGMTTSWAKRIHRGWILVESKDYGYWLAMSQLEIA